MLAIPVASDAAHLVSAIHRSQESARPHLAGIYTHNAAQSVHIRDVGIGYRSLARTLADYTAVITHYTSKITAALYLLSQVVRIHRYHHILFHMTVMYNDIVVSSTCYSSAVAPSHDGRCNLLRGDCQVHHLSSVAQFTKQSYAVEILRRTYVEVIDGIAVAVEYAIKLTRTSRLLLAAALFVVFSADRRKRLNPAAERANHLEILTLIVIAVIHVGSQLAQVLRRLY